MIKIGILGGTGYTGVELLRLLAVYPEVEFKMITSRDESGRKVADLFPNLRWTGGPNTAGAGTHGSGHRGLPTGSF